MWGCHITGGVGEGQDLARAVCTFLHGLRSRGLSNNTEGRPAPDTTPGLPIARPPHRAHATGPTAAPEAPPAGDLQAHARACGRAPRWGRSNTQQARALPLSSLAMPLPQEAHPRPNRAPRIGQWFYTSSTTAAASFSVSRSAVLSVYLLFSLG